MNKFTPGQRSEIARLIKKAKVKEREKFIEKVLELAENYYINRPVGVKMPTVVSREMYKMLLKDKTLWTMTGRKEQRSG